MSESNVTEKDVFNAADKLLAAGQRVSNRTVYDELGRKGSMETICPMLRKWRKLRNVPSRKSSGEDPPISDPLMAKAKDMVCQLRQEAKAEATVEIDAARVTSAEEVKAAEAERDSAIADATEADAELRVVERERDRLQQECKTAAAQVADLPEQIRDATARATAAEMREGELRKHAEDLKSELATSHRLHDEERQRSDQLRNEVAQVRSNLDANVLVLANAVADADHARALAVETKEQIEKVEAVCEQARREAKESGERAAGLQRELAAVKQKSDDFYALIKGEKSRIGKSAGKRTKSNVN